MISETPPSSNEIHPESILDRLTNYCTILRKSRTAVFRQTLVYASFASNVRQLTGFTPDLTTNNFRSLAFFRGITISTRQRVPRVSPRILTRHGRHVLSLLQKIPSAMRISIRIRIKQTDSGVLGLTGGQRTSIVFLKSPAHAVLRRGLFNDAAD